MKLTITELKDILRELDLTVSGRKNELVERIMQSQNDSTVLTIEEEPDREESEDDKLNNSEEATTIHAFLEAGLVDEFFLVLSTVEHAEPVDAGINAELLSNAGLLRFDDKKWGDEIVQHWSR